jgi:ketosteroid isomerase-like protein
MRQFYLLLFLVLSSSSFADSTTDADVAEIEALYETWREAVATGDIPKYLSVVDPTVRMIPPGADVIDSAASYEKFLQPVFEAATYRIEVDRYARIDVFGDHAVAEYDYTIHLSLKNPDQQVTEPGALTASVTQARYFDVLRKNPEGRWKVWRHTWQNK